MPELPEVETLRRSLAPLLVGRTVESVEARVPMLREPLDGAEIARRLVGGRIERLRRRAKYLLIDVEGGSTLVIHLGMSGRVTLAPPDAPEEPHEHLVLGLSSLAGREGDLDEPGGRTDREPREMRFRDPRRFGLAFALDTEAIPEDRHFAHLGIEPLCRDGAPDDEPLTGERLRALAAGRRGPVKTFLMDAKALVGVGNIYASEALFRAGIHPKRSVARIGRARWDRLAETVTAVLEEALAEGGTTLNDFRDGFGQEGYFQVSLAVYGREGEPCPRCGAAIRRIVQANRSTFYCVDCQT